MGKSLGTPSPDEASRWIRADCASKEDCLLMIKTPTDITDSLMDSKDGLVQICKEKKEGGNPQRLLMRFRSECIKSVDHPMLQILYIGKGR